MKMILSTIIDDFSERSLPALVEREVHMPEISGQVTVIVGMRRAGKTWFCYQHIKSLVKNGVDASRILYINFEDDRLVDFELRHFQDLIDTYYGKFPEHKDCKTYFFFDEIQRVTNWELFIRRIIDTEEVQVFLTGSSSKLLSTEIASTLRGRSISLEIFPFSFGEYLKSLGFEEPDTFGSKTLAVLRNTISGYIEEGGFPGVLGLSRELRSETLRNYLDVLILRDVIERHGITNVTALRHMVLSLLNCPGCLFSVNKFYNTLKGIGIKCSKDSLYAYLDHLVDAFLFYKVPIHTRSERVRLVNPTKVYAIDTGLLGAALFRNADNRGAFLETLVFMHLRRLGFSMEYWRSSDGRELDFRICGAQGRIQLIQVCWDLSSEKTVEREVLGLERAMLEFNIPEGTIITWDDAQAVSAGIVAKPFYRWVWEIKKDRQSSSIARSV